MTTSLKRKGMCRGISLGILLLVLQACSPAGSEKKATPEGVDSSTQALEEASHELQLAQQCPGYVGGNLPADFQIFSADSPWNLPIGPNPELDSHSTLIIDTLADTLVNDLGFATARLNVDHRKWSAPIHIINADQSPKVNIPSSKSYLHESVDPDRNAQVEEWPLPSCVWADPAYDKHMILVDPEQRKAWEFSYFEEGEHPIASRMALWDLDGVGYGTPFSGKGWWAFGATGEGTPYLSGLVKPEEFKQGRINHALAVIVPKIRKRISNDVSYNAELHSPVAARTDGRDIGPQYPPAGAHLQLDPSLDLDSLGLSEDSKVVARAAQEYGLFIIDKGDNFSVKFQVLDPSGNGEGWDFDINLESIPFEHFRVLQTQIVTK